MSEKIPPNFPLQKEREIRGIQPLPGSFRDPSGYVFRSNGILYRNINASYRPNYDRLMNCGLYQKLIEQELLIPHTEEYETSDGSLIIQPELLPFIAYAYEWSFSQLKKAALATLAIQKTALEFGMSLKDASAYNIQFRKGKPVLIDTLSFEPYSEDKPWIAYQQFCQHFLAPLALMAHTDIRLNQLLRVYLDGIPLDLTSRLLPKRTWLKFSFATHIHLHTRIQKKYSDTTKTPAQAPHVSRASLINILNNLESAIQRLSWNPAGTEWAEYYTDTNYSTEAFKEKQKILDEWVNHLQPKRLLDLGANTGEFSRIASDKGIFTIATDIDPAAVERNFLTAQGKKEVNLYPLLIDLANPSPGVGWGNEERDSFFDRAHSDLVLALALLHHLVISNNLPLELIAQHFLRLGDNLIIEFVPKEDSNAQRLLASRQNTFPDYTKEHFEAAFIKYFDVKKTAPLPNSPRILYLLEKKKQ